MKSERNLSWQSLLCYAMIAMPLAFAGIPLYIFLPNYYAKAYAMPLSTLSTALFLLRIFDGLIDPIIGYASDCCSRWRMLFFSLFFVLFLVGFWLLCMPITEYLLLSFTLGLLLTTTSFSVLTINIHALAASWHPSQSVKQQLISWREGIGLLGILIASILPSLLNPHYSMTQSYQIFAGVVTLLTCCCAVAFLHQLHNRPPAPHQPSIRWYSYYKKMDTTLKRTYLIYAVSALGSAIPAVMLLFFSEFVIETPQASGIYLFLYFSGAILALALWRSLLGHLSAIRSWSLSLFFSVAVFIWTFFLGPGDSFSFSVICLLSGIGLAAELVIPSLLLAVWVDQNHQPAYANGFFSLLTFIGKMALALATVICLPLLEQHGFSVHGKNSASTIQLISSLYALLPCTLKLLAGIGCLRLEKTMGQDHD